MDPMKMTCPPDGEIHLWFAFFGLPRARREEERPSPISSPGQVSAGEALREPAAAMLDHEERSRLERFRTPGGRRLFALSHALVRRALSRYRDVPPQAWRFLRGDHGKPAIAPEMNVPPLTFSLAHTRGAALVAIAGGAEIGADLERGDREVDAQRLSRRFFAPEEAAGLGKMAPEGLAEGFFHLWTLKESYVKARGLGLLIPLDSFSFRLSGDEPRRIGFAGPGPEDQSRWRFALLSPRPPYVAALAFAAAGSDVRLRCFALSPAGKASPLSALPLGLSPGVSLAPAGC